MHTERTCSSVVLDKAQVSKRLQSDMQTDLQTSRIDENLSLLELVYEETHPGTMLGSISLHLNRLSNST